MRLGIFARAMRRHRADYLWPFEILARRLAAGGHEVTVFTTALPDGTGARFDDGGVSVHHLQGTRPERIDAAFHAASAAAHDAAGSGDAPPFDVILGRGDSSWGFLSRSRHAGRVPLISHEGTYPGWLHRAEIGRNPLVRLAVPMMAWDRARKRPELTACLRASDRVLCLTPALSRALGRAYWWHPPRRVVLPYGFDPASFAAPLPHRAEPVPRIVHVARLTPAKGADALAPILARLGRLGRPEVVLEAIGPATEEARARVMAQARAEGVADRLRLVGPLPHSELPGRLAGAAAFLLPTRHPEGLSKVVMEAMAMGLPVVTCAVPGMEALVAEGRTGLLVRPGDEAAAAHALAALLADPARAARMGAAGRERLLQDFAPARIDAAWDALLAEVVAGHKAGKAR